MSLLTIYLLSASSLLIVTSQWIVDCCTQKDMLDHHKYVCLELDGDKTLTDPGTVKKNK